MEGGVGGKGGRAVLMARMEGSVGDEGGRAVLVMRKGGQCWQEGGRQGAVDHEGGRAASEGEGGAARGGEGAVSEGWVGEPEGETYGGHCLEVVHAVLGPGYKVHDHAARVVAHTQHRVQVRVGRREAHQPGLV